MSGDLLVRMTTNPVATWLIKHVAAPLDPILFRATNGRLTIFGPPALPMLTLTARGRRSGKPRSVHLACIEHEGDHLIVASAMGQPNHPDWRYNVEADPKVEIQMQGERFRATAQVLGDREKEAVWDKVLASLPQIRVYQTRTDRNIRVFRIRRATRDEVRSSIGR